MSGFIDSAVKGIDGRLLELKEEEKRLQTARAALLGTKRVSGRPARASKTKSKRGPGRPRGRGNTRSNQALKLIKSRPGITTSQIAEALKIESTYLYRVMPKLTAANRIRRDGSGWYLVASSAEE